MQPQGLWGACSISSGTLLLSLGGAGSLEGGFLETTIPFLQTTPCFVALMSETRAQEEAHFWRALRETDRAVPLTAEAGR